MSDNFIVECANCGLLLGFNEHPLADQACIRCGFLERTFTPTTEQTETVQP